MSRVCKPATVNVVGTEISLVDYDKTIDLLEHKLAEGGDCYVVPAATHALMVGRKDVEMRMALNNATAVVPDGMPVVWAAKRMGAKLKDRVYGPELMRRFCARCAEKGYRIWLYGGYSDEALEALAEALKRDNPGIEVAGFYSPYRPEVEIDESVLVERINSDRPDVLWVGTGAPSQEKWMYRMQGRLDVPVMIGVGAAFDFLAGRVKQAPPWMQRLGLEWLYRVLKEPHRLAGRYLKYNTKFLVAFARQYLGDR